MSNYLGPIYFKISNAFFPLQKNSAIIQIAALLIARKYFSFYNIGPGFRAYVIASRKF